MFVLRGIAWTDCRCSAPMNSRPFALKTARDAVQWRLRTRLAPFFPRRPYGVRSRLNVVQAATASDNVRQPVARRVWRWLEQRRSADGWLRLSLACSLKHNDNVTSRIPDFRGSLQSMARLVFGLRNSWAKRSGQGPVSGSRRSAVVVVLPGILEER